MNHQNTDTGDTRNNNNTEQSWSEFYSASNSTEEQIAKAFEQIESVSRSLCLNEELREKAAEIYGAASKAKITDGRPTKLVVGGAICVASRKEDQPRPTKRVAFELNIEPNKLNQMVRQLQAKLDMGYIQVSPTAYIKFPCEKAELPPETKTQAEQIIETADESEEFTYKSLHPAGIAGAAIYITTSDVMTQQRVATLIGVSDETIRKRVADLQEVIN